jgi:DNA-binding cell septation regulator SpoVG
MKGAFPSDLCFIDAFCQGKFPTIVTLSGSVLGFEIESGEALAWSATLSDISGADLCPLSSKHILQLSNWIDEGEGVLPGLDIHEFDPKTETWGLVANFVPKFTNPVWQGDGGRRKLAGIATVAAQFWSKMGFTCRTSFLLTSDIHSKPATAVWTAGRLEASTAIPQQRKNIMPPIPKKNPKKPEAPTNDAGEHKDPVERKVGESFTSATSGLTYSATAYPIKEPKGKTLAFANLTVSGASGEAGLVVKDFTVVNGDKGVFVGSPQRKGPEGYLDTAFTVSKNDREAAHRAILSAYEAA